MMRSGIYILLTGIIIFLLLGCMNKDEKRITELMEMPVLWDSEIVVANPRVPEMKKMVAMFDSYDAPMAQAWSKDEFTEDYIPEDAMAFATARYRNKPRTITIQVADQVGILGCKKNNIGKQTCLVRTEHDTYAWLYAFHLCDKDGDRMGSL